MAADSNMFTVPATLADRYRTEEERIGPQTVVPEASPAVGDISFFCPPSSHAFISLPELAFELELAIKKRPINTVGEWNFIEANDPVAPVNFIAHSIFQTCQVSLSDRVVSDTSTNYPYRAMFEALTMYSESAVKTQLTAGGFYGDTPDQHENHVANLGEQQRQKLFVDMKWVEFSGKVLSDVTEQSKNLITGVPIKVKYVLNRPEFYLRTWTPAPVEGAPPAMDYRLFIRNPRLLVKRNVGTPDFMNAVAKRLIETPAKYHLEKQILRVNDIPRGVQSHTISNMHLGQLPKMVLCALVENTNFQGTFQTNPFKFVHKNLTRISVEVDGLSFPTKPYEVDFSHGRSLEAFNGLLDVLGRKHLSTGSLLIDRSDYNKGYSVIKPYA